VNDKAAAALSEATQLYISLAGNARSIKSSGNVVTLPGGRVGDGQFLGVLPVPREFHVSPGRVITRAGPVEMTAEFDDWDYLWQGDKPVGWMVALTSGRLVIPRWLLLEAQPGFRTMNSFAVQDYGPHFILITLDRARKHRLGILQDSGGTWRISAGTVGSKADVNGEIVVRQADGWYSNGQRVQP